MTYIVEDFVRQEQAFYSCPVNSCTMCFTNLMLMVQHVVSRHITVQGGTRLKPKASGQGQRQGAGQDEDLVTISDDELPAQEGIPEQDTPSTVRCTVCQKDFGNKGALKKHIMFKHKEQLDQNPQGEKKQQKKTLVCQWCPKAFSKKSSLMKHARVAHEHAGDKPKSYSEEILDAVTEEVRNETGKAITDEGPEEVSDKVSEEVLDEDDIAARRPLNETVSPVLLQCKMCDKECGNKGALKQHIKAKHKDELTDPAQDSRLSSEQQKTVECQWCSKVFSRKSSLKKHMRIAHEEEKDNPAKASQSASQKHDSSDKDHEDQSASEEISEETPAEIPEEISEYDSENISEDDLEEFPEEATDDDSEADELLISPKSSKKKQAVSKTWQCPFCDKECKDKNALKRHVWAKHGTNPRPDEEPMEDQEQQSEDEEAPGLCSSCHSSPSSPSSPLCSACRDKERQIACSICPKTFNRRTSCRTHEADIHNLAPRSKSNPDAIQCNFCGKPFQRFSELEEHVRADHKDMFQCLNCHKISPTRGALKRHLNSCTASGTK